MTLFSTGINLSSVERLLIKTALWITGRKGHLYQTENGYKGLWLPLKVFLWSSCISYPNPIK